MRYMTIHWLFRVLLANSLLFCVSTGLAGIHVLPQMLEFSDKTLRHDVTVFNDDKKNMAYVNITILRHNNDIGASGQNNTNDQSDFIPIAHATEAGLVVTPAKLVLAPGASRLVRIQLTKAPGDIERVYQILVSPVEGDLVPMHTDQNKIQAGVHLVISYGILTIVAPTHIQPNLTLNRQGNEITAVNSGNVSIRLSNGQQCIAGKCEKISVYRVYPGGKTVFKVPSAAPVTFTQEYVGGGASPIQSN